MRVPDLEGGALQQLGQIRLQRHQSRILQGQFLHVQIIAGPEAARHLSTGGGSSTLSLQRHVLEVYDIERIYDALRGVLQRHRDVVAVSIAENIFDNTSSSVPYHTPPC